MKKLIILLFVISLTSCTAVHQNPPISSTDLLSVGQEPVAPTPTPTSTFTPAPTPTAIVDLEPYLTDNTLKPMEVMIQESILGSAGSLISATLFNDSKEVRNYSLTCGFTFVPRVNMDLQQMILIQPLNFSMEPDGWVFVYPVTVSIEPQKDVPVKGETYSFGPKAEGNLKKLADCSCSGSISPEDTITLFTQQMAFWMVDLGKDSSEVASMTPEQLVSLLASMEIDKDLLDSFSDFLPLLQSSTVRILEQCGL